MTAATNGTEARARAPYLVTETTQKAERFLDRVAQVTAQRAEPAPAFDALSPSSLNCFMECQVKYFYRKILDLPEPRGAALGLGTAVHAAIAENFRQKIETREDLPTEGVVALFRDAWEHALPELALDADDDPSELRGCGENLVRVYLDQAAPSIQPAAVELHVAGLIGDVPVHGYVDVLTVDGTIIDLKTAKKRDALRASHRTQLVTYAMLTPGASGETRLDTVTKTKRTELTQQTLRVADGDRRHVTRLYSIAREQMASGVFLPNRGGMLCSRKYCAFAARCIQDFGGEVK